MDDPNLCNPDLDDVFLETLSVRELKDLNGRIELAIRAAIRSRNAALSGRNATVVRAPVTDVAAPPAMVDLERERDAWLARRNSRQA